MLVAVLIDGFNLYHHMDNDRYRKYKWLNFNKLFRNYINKSDQPEIHYFTTIYYEDTIEYRRNPKKIEGKLRRHLNLIQAEKSYGVFVHYGEFKIREFVCEKCRHKNLIWQEKQTDVNLGSYLIYLAFSRDLDNFIILSADSDLIAAIKLVKENSDSKKIRLLLPPGISKSAISKYCDHTHEFTDSILSDSLFPLIFTNKKGETISYPLEWR